MKSECFLQGVQSYAAKAREPRQVRKEAAVSGVFWVPWGHWTPCRKHSFHKYDL